MRTICRSDLAGEIKAALTMDQVARHYGFEPNRAGFIRCPFHTGDRTASLKLYPGTGGWCCFGCRRGGSVIDFVMELYGLSFAQAVVRLSADLGLGAAGEGPGPAAARERAAEERRRALAVLKALPVEITGPRPVEEAIVTSGGVAVKEVNPSTMESKVLPGLYFAGEVLDVDAYTGGFNLQIAWCTGRLAGEAAAS